MEEKNILQPAGSPNDVVKGLFVGKNIFQPIGDVKGLTVVNQRPALGKRMGEKRKRGKQRVGLCTPVRITHKHRESGTHSGWPAWR